MSTILKVRNRDIKIEGRLVRIARLDADKYHFLDDPEPILDGLRKSKTRVDLFTFIQRLPETTQKYDYPMEWDNLAVLPVSTFEKWWKHQIGSFPRNRARQAEKKGVILKEVPFDDVLVHGIWEVYNECPFRQGQPFSHFGKDLDSVRKMSATFLDHSLFIGAFIGNSLIGFVKLTWDETRTQACLMHIVSMVQHKDKAPTNALIAQAVRSCAERNIQFLVYQNFYYGKKRDDGLSNFKEVNGFKPVDVPRYFVPLTLVGQAALDLGLHKKISDHLPRPVLVKLLELRNSWYQRKQQTAMARS